MAGKGLWIYLYSRCGNTSEKTLITCIIDSETKEKFSFAAMSAQLHRNKRYTESVKGRVLEVFTAVVEEHGKCLMFTVKQVTYCRTAYFPAVTNSNYYF